MAAYALPLGLCRAAIIVGAMFKIQHWPAAGLLLLLGAVGCALFEVLRYAVLPDRGLPELMRLVFGIAFPALIVFKLLHWPYKMVPLVLSGVSLLVGFFVGAWTSPIPTSARSPSPPLFFVLGMVCVLAGTVFRIQHWPYSSALLLIGLVCCGIWIAQDWRAAAQARNGEGTNEETTDD